MTQIASFADLKIDKPTIVGFIGEKIAIKKILNQEITVHFFKIGPSKFTEKGSGIRLDMQITYKEEKRLLWTNSTSLLKMAEDIKTKHGENFAFKTKIIQDEETNFFYFTQP